jgi:hypothetical protein
MDVSESVRAQRWNSVPAQIAWLSLGVLAAASGHALNETWQPIWSEMGGFGLTAAVGLGRLDRARWACREMLRDGTLRVRLEGGLARLNRHNATLDSINEAVSRLAEHASKRLPQSPNDPASSQSSRQAELLQNYPLEITPIEGHNALSDSQSLPSMAGTLSRISSRAISFEHTEPFTTHMVLLTFTLGEGQQLSFAVEVKWTEKMHYHFTSGGTVLAVGVPATRDRGAANTAASDVRA